MQFSPQILAIFQTQVWNFLLDRVKIILEYSKT